MFGDIVSHEIRSSRAERHRLTRNEVLLAPSNVVSWQAASPRAVRQELEGRPWRALSHTRQACRMRAAVALFVPRALAGIMGVDREGGYAIPFLTRVGGGDHARWQGSHALGGIACASWTRISSIIPYSVRAESMTSLFTSELRLATLFPAGSEYQDGNCRNGSGLHTRRVSRTVRRGRIELEAGHIRAGSVT